MDEVTGIQYKVCDGNIERNMMTAKKKEVTKDISLTQSQVDKLNLYSARLNAATATLNEYLGAVLDAKEVTGAWDVLGIENKTLKLRAKEG